MGPSPSSASGSPCPAGAGGSAVPCVRRAARRRRGAQGGLGTARGDAELLVEALDAVPAPDLATRVRRALEHLPPYDECPVLRAELSLRLGDALMVDDQSDRQRSVAEAIEAYRDASTMRIEELDAPWWAHACGRLANAYLQREDERAEAGEEASQACDDALSVLTRDKWPDEWTQLTLLRAWAKLQWRPDLAVDDFKHGLEALDRGRSPAAWAQAQDGLAHALMLRAIHQKISAFPSVSAEDWANVLGDLDMDDAAVAADLPVVESPTPSAICWMRRMRSRRQLS